MLWIMDVLYSTSIALKFWQAAYMTFQSPSFFSWLIFSPTRLSTLFLKGKCHQYICATSLYRKIEVDWRYCYVILAKSNFVSNGKDQNYAIIYKSGAKKCTMKLIFTSFFSREKTTKNIMKSHFTRIVRFLKQAYIWCKAKIRALFLCLDFIVLRNI